MEKCLHRKRGAHIDWFFWGCLNMYTLEYYALVDWIDQKNASLKNCYVITGRFHSKKIRRKLSSDQVPTQCLTYNERLLCAEDCCRWNWKSVRSEIVDNYLTMISIKFPWEKMLWKQKTNDTKAKTATGCLPLLLKSSLKHNHAWSEILCLSI